jgi:hypothetical protein
VGVLTLLGLRIMLESMQEEHNPPMVLAMMVCEGIYRDIATGKWTLLGCFTGFMATAFPCVHPAMVVFVSVTDGRDNPQLRLVLVDAEEEREPIVTAEMPVAFEDPRMVADVVFGFQNVSFPEPGEYRFRLFAGNEILMERRIIVAGPP